MPAAYIGLQANFSVASRDPPTRRGTLAVYNWRRLATLTTSSRLLLVGLEVKNELPRRVGRMRCCRGTRRRPPVFRSGWPARRLCFAQMLQPYMRVAMHSQEQANERLQLMSSVAVIALGLAVASAAFAAMEVAVSAPMSSLGTSVVGIISPTSICGRQSAHIGSHGALVNPRARNAPALAGRMWHCM